jgi:outer membrane scaffolding protein for murein synthesis (MipA/OmpV family)
MSGRYRRTPRRCLPLALVGLLLWAGAMPRSAWSQTPSPLQEWQYSGGIILARLFQPNLPEWSVITGVAAETQPIYNGAQAYRVQGGPVINIQYYDIAFATTGEGLGVNFLRGDHYRLGAAISYDFGRRVRDDYANLRGMGDLSAAPVVKLFGSYVLSKKFVMFAGPSITFATHRYLQSEFGVTPAQSLASGHPVFDPHAGTVSVGVGFSATKFVTDHWLLSIDAALTKLKGSPDISPVIENSTERVLALSLDYRW